MLIYASIIRYEYQKYLAPYNTGASTALLKTCIYLVGKLIKLLYMLCCVAAGMACLRGIVLN